MSVFHSFFISISFAAYQSIRLQLMNTVKHRRGCYTHVYIDRKFDKSKGETAKVNYRCWLIILT